MWRDGSCPAIVSPSKSFPLIVETLARLRSRSCIIDGEAVACDDNGVASFNLIRYRRHDDSTFLYAFDLIELNGDDLRRDPLEVRKATLASIVAKAGPGIRFNEHIEGDGPTALPHACSLAWKASHPCSLARPTALDARKIGSRARTQSPQRLKREAEEDWGKKKWR